MEGRSLEQYIVRRFELSFYHKFSISDLDNLPVWEFDLLYDQVINALQVQENTARGVVME